MEIRDAARAHVVPWNGLANLVRKFRFHTGVGLISVLASLPCWGSVTVDANVHQDLSQASTQITTPAFSTASPNELLLAFIASDGLSSPTIVSSVTGAGLTWIPVARVNATGGTSEIWRAFAVTPVSNVTVTATLAQKVFASIQVVSFAGVDTTGLNGAGAIGAVSINSGLGVPSASLVSTRANSLVFGVGNDYDNAKARTVGSGQTLLHQDLSPTNNDTYWMQQETNPVPTVGTKVTINDTAPSSDHFNLAICEILPPGGTTAPGISSLSASSGTAGTSVNISGSNFGAAQGNGGVTFGGVDASIVSWSPSLITALVPYGAATGNVVVAAADGVSSNGVTFAVPGTAAGLAIDATATGDSTAPSTQLTTSSFSTSAGNELLLAFIATDARSAGMQVSSVSGGGLGWTLVKRTNQQLGDTEVWRAFASSALSNVTVTATLAQSVVGSIQIVSFTGVDTSGTNGSGAIGATAGGNANPGAPTASLITTRANSWIFGVGNDYDKSISRTLGAGQALLHQFWSSTNDTYWMQRQDNTTAASGTSITLNDVAPSTDRYNLTLVEVLPSPGPVISSISPGSDPVGDVVTISGSGFGSTRGLSTVTFGGVAAAPATWSDSQITVPVPVGAQLGSDPVVVTAAEGASNAVMFVVATPLVIVATSAPPANANGWNNTNVTISYQCSGGVPPVQCPGAKTVSTEGANQSFTATALDANANAATVATTVSVDKTPPAVTATSTPALNGAGWSESAVSIQFGCSDSLSGVKACPSPVYVLQDGANQVISGTAIDLAGNAATASITVSIDQTPPQVSVTSPADGTVLNAASTVLQGTISDGLSGVGQVTCNSSPAIVSGSSFSCSVPLALGRNPVVVRAADVAGNTTAANITLARASLIQVQVTAPTPLQLFSNGPITVTGTVDQPDAAVAVNGIPATVTNGVFTASGIALREGKNLVTVSATTPEGGAGSDAVSVFLDTTPPVVHIDTPNENAVVTSPQIDVTGNVNDLVTGTVNGDQVGVVVNGVTAGVANRSFAAHGVLLVPGVNTITAVATDRAGNVSQHQVHVILQQLPGQQTLSIVSGNGQSGAINTALPQPLVVHAADALGRPIVNRALDFAVFKSDGILSSGQQLGRHINLQTDLAGNASVQFTLGSRSGAGVNQVAVSAPGFAGQVVFSADSTVGTPAQIHTVSGDVQTGAVGAALPEPLVAIVLDAGGNPVSGVPVTFTVAAGSGLINGQATFAQNTDGDGQAFAILTLAQQAGVGNNVVTASFPGLTGLPSVFISSAVVPGPVANTTVSGIVLDDANTPIVNATASIKGTNLSTVTDASGRFLISGAPMGNIVLFVDGSTSTDTDSYPTLSFQMSIIPGVDNSLPGPVYLPALDTSNSQVVGGNQDVILTMKNVPGVAYKVFANSVTFPDGTHVGRLTLSQVHADRVPMVPMNGEAPRLVGTLQPTGVKFDPPIQMILPNTDGLKPGQVEEIFSFHHDVEQFVVEGTARVSEDGSVLITDAGFGLTVSGWHGSGNPKPKTDAKKDDCQKAADDLQQQIDSIPAADPTQSFRRIQVCIARTACAPGSPIQDPQLKPLVGDFINRFLNNTSGQWPATFQKCTDAQNLQKVALCQPPYNTFDCRPAFFPDFAVEDICANAMADTHINYDLLQAMIARTCFSPPDWDNLFDIIKACTKTEMNKFQGTIASWFVESRRNNVRAQCCAKRGCS